MKAIWLWVKQVGSPPEDAVPHPDTFHGLYYPAAEVEAYRAKVLALVEAIKKYQEMAILVLECKYEDLAAVRERFELSCINLNAALAALEADNE